MLDYFRVRMHYKNKPAQDYQFADEVNAVLFAARYSRDMGIRGDVFDPHDNLLVRFEPREYDVRAYTDALCKRRQSSIAAGFVDPLRSERAAPKKKKPLKKAASSPPKKKVLKKR